MGTVLVTGVGGFVGSHILEAVLEHTDHDVIGVDSWRHNGLSNNVIDVVAPLGREATRATILTHDMTAPFSRRAQRTLADVDWVINVASRCSVDESIDDPAGFVRNNINLMLELFEWARLRQGQPFRRIIHMSTDEVFGPPGADVLLNGHAPSSPYSASKAAQEDLCRAYRRTYNLPITIINSANMFGPRQSTLAFIPRVIRAIHTGTPVDIHYGVGGQQGRRCYTYVGNVANRVARLLDHDGMLGRLVLTGQEEIGNNDLARRIGKLMEGHGQLKTRIVPAETARPGYDQSYPPMRPDYHHWSEGLTTVEDGLQATIDWALAEPSMAGQL